MGLVFEFEGDFGGTLASLWDQCWHMRVTLGSLWSRSGATWGAFWAYGGDFRSLWHHYGTIVESFWVKEVRFQKTLIFPTDFNDFIKLCS